MRWKIPALLLLGLVIPVFATSAAPPAAHAATVKCQPTVNVWIEIDAHGLSKNERAKTEVRKRAPLSLIGSSTSRGEAVICSYATRGREVTTSYSVRCPNPRRATNVKHAYTCG